MSFLRSFHLRVPGKWVLAGEHAVLRGGMAVALPHPEFALELQFQPQVWQGLSVVPPRLEGFVTELLARLESESQQRGLRWTAPRGSLVIESALPLGAGLGSSAALCVALTRWLQEELRLADSGVFGFARSLEDRFHGKSSGMDVAVALEQRPIRFTRAEGATPLVLGRVPKFTFHDTGLRASTKECIAKVEALWAKNPAAGEQLDAQMKQAAAQAADALERHTRGAGREGLVELAEAMSLAQGAFEGWGLVPDGVRQQIVQLKAQGARAVKLTGAGGGGFLVALWD